MLEALFRIMDSKTIIIKGDGFEAKVTKDGPLIVLDIVSDRRISDEQIKSTFGIPDGFDSISMLVSGASKRSRASWPVMVV